MNINLSDILPSLTNIVTEVEALEGPLAAIPSVAKINGLVSEALAIATDLDKAVTQGTVIAESDDQEALTALIDTLMTKAEAVGVSIDKS